uniref:Uncharacterized protein n=1 Tax=Arundo donax TaxID=35708 RepID=A0A0A9GL22_ARUDO
MKSPFSHCDHFCCNSLFVKLVAALLTSIPQTMMTYGTFYIFEQYYIDICIGSSDIHR